MTATVVIRSRTGPLTWLASTDHKRVAALTTVTAGVFFALGGLLALLIRAELFSPGMQIVGHDRYNQAFTMHGSTMVYLVVVPLSVAIGVYLVPLQVGAAEIAWPRLALLGFWLYAAGGLTMWAGFFTNHGSAKAGWTAYFPLSDTQFTPGAGMDLWILGVLLATAGPLLMAICVLGTLLRLRAPGMTMLRLPVLSWTQLVTAFMVILSFPVLLVALGLLLWSRTQGSRSYPGGPIDYQHLFWFYGHPVVYVMFFPFVGAVGEVLATFTRRRFFAYRGMVLSLLLFTSLSMSVWAHHMFATGQVANQYFAFTSTLLLIPAGLEYFAMVGTLLGGRIRLTTPMLFALGFVVQFVIGGVTGIIVASPPLDYHAHDTYFIVAHFHYTLFAGSLFGLFAGLYYWFPKATGRLFSERLGKLHFWLLALGTNLAFFPMFLLGYDGMPRRVANYDPYAGFTGLNRVSTVGSWILAVAMLVFLWNLVRTVRRGAWAGNDPWDGHTLEWWTTSPPPRHNFASLPPVRSYAPLLDLSPEERS